MAPALSRERDYFWRYGFGFGWLNDSSISSMAPQSTSASARGSSRSSLLSRSINLTATFNEDDAAGMAARAAGALPIGGLDGVSSTAALAIDCECVVGRAWLWLACDAAASTRSSSLATDSCIMNSSLKSASNSERGSCCGCSEGAGSSMGSSGLLQRVDESAQTRANRSNTSDLSDSPHSSK